MGNPKYIISYISSWNQTFTFSAPYTLDRGGLPTSDLVHQVPAISGVGSDGEFQADATFEARRFSLAGTLASCDPTLMGSYVDTLTEALADRKAGRVRVRKVDGATVYSDRFISCRVMGRMVPAPSMESSIKWSAMFRSDGYAWQDWNPNDGVALASGANVVTVGGTEENLPSISWNATAVGKMTIAGALGAITVDCDVTGVWIVSMENRTILRPASTGNYLSRISAGGFFPLPPRATNVTLTASAGLTFTDGGLIARKRWATAG